MLSENPLIPRTIELESCVLFTHLRRTEAQDKGKEELESVGAVAGAEMMLRMINDDGLVTTKC